MQEHDLPKVIFFVAPFTGAWIEILICTFRMHVNESLPSRERGLKLMARPTGDVQIMSLPSRERGLECGTP